MSKTYTTTSYECLCERNGIPFYSEGHSSLEKAKKEIRRMKANFDSVDSDLSPACNFRIVKHEITDRETVVKTYPEWDKR